MLASIRRANEILRALPKFMKVAITIQCLAPSVVLWFQFRLLEIRSMELSKTVEVLQQFQKALDVVPSAKQILTIYLAAIKTAHLGDFLFPYFLVVNLVFGFLGFAIICLMTWKPKASSQNTSAENPAT